MLSPPSATFAWTPFHIEELKLELEQLTDRLGIESELQLTLVAEAKQYRISEARRQQLEGGSI
jgi:hypothetical protein